MFCDCWSGTGNLGVTDNQQKGSLGVPNHPPVNPMTRRKKEKNVCLQRSISWAGLDATSWLLPNITELLVSEPMDAKLVVVIWRVGYHGLTPLSAVRSEFNTAIRARSAALVPLGRDEAVAPGTVASFDVRSVVSSLFGISETGVGRGGPHGDAVPRSPQMRLSPRPLCFFLLLLPTSPSQPPDAKTVGASFFSRRSPSDPSDFGRGLRTMVSTSWKPALALRRCSSKKPAYLQ